MAGTTRGTVVRRPLGACCLDDHGTFFRVWAPRAQAVHVHLVGPGARLVALAPEGDGYFAGEVDGAGPGTRYRYRLDDGDEFPDPASAHQPDGVHGPSAVIDERFAWSDAAWRGHAREDLVIYELHVGTFTRDGTFDAIHPHLPALRELGVTAIELMPVAQFPGARNWGYDGVYPFAVQHSYGGPDGLKRLVDTAHAVGLSVLLDVVYNHLGPEGNHLAHFGPYFTDRYQTPWGQALDFDGPRSGPIRHFFVENARRYFERYEKAKRAAKDIPALRREAEQEIGYVEQLATDLALAESWPEIEAVREALQEAGYWRGAKKAGPRGGRPGIRRFTTEDGFVILVGRNAAHNHALVTERSAGEDLWLHARGVPGSHVIVKHDGRPIPDDVIERAAQLAAYYSAARGDAAVEVDVTARRYVRPVKRGKPGMVTYRNERTLRVRPALPIEADRP